MTANRLALFILACTVFSICGASPIRPEMIGLAIYVEDATGLEGRLEDETYRPAYAFVVSALAGPWDEDGVYQQQPTRLSNLRKRSAAHSEDLEDLETAAGTNALRPLFVYRQQVAYRQRIREAIRRGNRF